MMIYFQGDCKFFKYKPLSFNLYQEPGGQGEMSAPETSTSQKFIKWVYPQPKSLNETIIKTVCDKVK